MKRIASIILSIALIAGYVAAVTHHKAPSARWLKCSLHCHTTASDGLMTREAVLAEYERQGYDVVAITDHDVWGASGTYGKMLVIAGCEETCYGPYRHEGVLGGKADRVRVLNHPLFTGLTAEQFAAAMTYCAAYEGYNGTCDYSNDKGYAVGYTSLTDCPAIAVDDSHCLKIIGMGYTMVYAEPNEASILQAIRTGHVRMVIPE